MKRQKNLFQFLLGKVRQDLKDEVVVYDIVSIPSR